MKTLLVLTDFSDVAMHAAEYACHLSLQFKSEKIILLNAYNAIQPVAQQPLTMVSDQETRLEISGKMDKMKIALQALANPYTEIKFTAAEGTASGLVNFISGQENADMVIMGITYKTGVERVISGSTTTEVIESSEYPVLIVPPNASMHDLKTIVLATDVKEVEDSMPVDEIKKVLNPTNAKLVVLNVDKDDKNISGKTTTELLSLNRLLQEYHPEYHYVNDENIIDGIAHFAENINASLVIVMHEKKDFFSRLFHQSVSKRLAFYSSVPMLSIRKK